MSTCSNDLSSGEQKQNITRTVGHFILDLGSRKGILEKENEGKQKEHGMLRPAF